MTVATLAQTIKRIPPNEQAKLFDKLALALEDCLLAKITENRFQKATAKRIPWEQVNCLSP